MSGLEHSEVDIKLQRVDRIYRPGENVEGVVIVKAKAGWSHQGVRMRVEGCARLEPSNRSLGMLDSVYGNVKPLEIVLEEIEIVPPGRLPDGITEVPFEFIVQGIGGKPMYETYHGVYINVCYIIAVDCERGVMKKTLHREIEFIVEVPNTKKQAFEALPFTITPESLENVRPASLRQLPKFKLVGKFHRLTCPIHQPFTGELVVEFADTPIRSIEVQLVRVETIIHHDTQAREATEVQNIQIGDDDVCRGIPLPIHMVFPRLFTCATMITNRFRVEFEVNLIVVFQDGYMVTENFPVTLIRTR